MEFLGDIERFVATNLYPLRLPIAIAGVLVVVAVVVLARRRRWDLVARRHPGRSLAITALVLVVGLPTAWYLGSPLFVRTELQEPGPGATPGPGASPGPGSSDDMGGTNLISRGDFAGADDFHFGRGRASIVEVEPGRFTLRLDDFSVQNGPDLFVYLSPDPSGYADGAVELGGLRATDGSFGYDLPAGLDPTIFRSAVIWCRQFAVQFAAAPLAPA